MNQDMYVHIHAIEQSHWWYTARRKIIFEWVFRILSKYSVPRILDVGCGTGFNLEYLAQKNYQNVFGLDFSPQALRFCQSRHLAFLICGDGEHPPLRYGSFDVILALDLIEHLEDDVSALRELAHLLKPGGTLIIFTPAFMFLWGLQDMVSHHYRRYTADELRRKVNSVGLNIEKISYANTFLFPLIWFGRQILKLSNNTIQGTSENDLHPDWSNNILRAIFASERFFLRYINFPVGVSLFCISTKPSTGSSAE